MTAETPERATIGSVLDAAARRLAGVAGEGARLESEILLAYTLEKARSYLYAWPEEPLEEGKRRACEVLVERRASGEPIAYLIARQEFWSLDLKVTPDTLIPRADTEILVEQALMLIPETGPFRVADLGTGSGAIAAAIATERPLAQVVATDASEPALAVARENMLRLRIGNVACMRGSWCDALPAGKWFDLIVSNPPYVPVADPHMSRGDLRWEPRHALTPGPEGLESLRVIARQAPGHLAEGGFLVLEHGFDQGEAVRGILQAEGFHAIRTVRDLAGKERVTRGRKMGRRDKALDYFIPPISL